MSPPLEISHAYQKAKGIMPHLKMNEELYSELIDQVKRENRQKKVTKFIDLIQNHDDLLRLKKYQKQ